MKSRINLAGSAAARRTAPAAQGAASGDPRVDNPSRRAPDDTTPNDTMPGDISPDSIVAVTIAVAARPELTLRPWRAGDEAALVHHADNRAVWRNLTDRFPHPYTAEDAARWVGGLQRGVDGGHFAIVVDDVPVGGCGFVPHEEMERLTADIGYWLGESFWGRGIASAALGALTGYLFEHTSFERLQAIVYEWNPASMRVLERNGYVREGWMRRSAIKDGRLIDRALYARLRKEPLPATEYA